MIFASAGHASFTGAQEPAAPPPLPADPVLPDEPEAAAPLEDAGPSPGALTLTLPQAVGEALSGNFRLLSGLESVEAAKLRYGAARAQFYPQLVPRYVHGDDEQSLTVDASQRLPYTGGSVTATGVFRSRPEDVSPAPKSADLNLTLTQPLLRGLGPNASLYDLRNSRRAQTGQERALELARQQVAVDVARAFYRGLQQRMRLA